MFELNEKPTGQGMRIAIVAARFNRFIVEQLLEGALDALERQGVADEDRALVWGRGAYESPVVADQFAASGRYDAVIALGAVIRGGTPHFDFVAGECASGLTRVALDRGVPVTFGVLTTDDVEQAVERAATTHRIAQAVAEGADAAAAQIELGGLDEASVVGHLAKVPTLAVYIDHPSIDTVLGQRQAVVVRIVAERRPVAEKFRR